MSVSSRHEPGASDAFAERALAVSGVLMLVGFAVNGIQRMLLHPSGAEDDHEAIFTEYAESDVWVFTHFVEFVLVLVAFAGLLTLVASCSQRRPSSRRWRPVHSSWRPLSGPRSKGWMASRSSSP